MQIPKLRLIGLGVALILLTMASGYRGIFALAQAGTLVTVCATGCNFATIQAAIDASSGGATIQVQAGIYKENVTIKNKDGLTLQGAGADQVTLDGDGPNKKEIIPGIKITTSKNVTITGFKIINSRRGLEADDATQLLIQANTFDKNLRQGISLVSSEAQVVENMVQGTQSDLDGSRGQGIGISGSEVVISDTTITENIDCGIRIFFHTERSSEVTGSGNSVTGNRGGDLCGNLSLKILAQPPAEGTLAQVTVPTDVPTIQEAVNRVQSGGAIIVTAGTYQQPVQSGPVQIYKSLRIIGAGPEQTVLQAPGPEWVAINVATDQIQVTIEGVKVTGARLGMQIATGSGASVTLRNVKVDGNGTGKAFDGGLSIFGQGTVTLDQVSVSGNKSSGFSGLSIFDQAKVTIQNSTIANNNAISGISLSSSSQATIQKSTITDNSGFGGISLYDSASATIDDNTIARNVEEGIFVGGSARAQVTNNQITATKRNPQAQGCCGFGINLRYNAQATIEGNTISNNASSGIILQEDSQATSRRNTISDNSHGGVTVMGRTKATFNDDTITGLISDN